MKNKEQFGIIKRTESSPEEIGSDLVSFRNNIYSVLFIFKRKPKKNLLERWRENNFEMAMVEIEKENLDIPKITIKKLLS
jgi:hypothetical protein